MLGITTIVLTLFAGLANGADVYRPSHVSYNELQSHHVEDRLLKELQHSGLVVIRNVPSLHKREMLASFDRCMASSTRDNDAIVSHKYEDGTIRHTIATHTMPVVDKDPIQVPLALGDPQCQDFEKVSHHFRHSVHDVTNLLSERLTGMLQNDGNQAPLLNTTHGAMSFDTLLDVVQNGEHLEHFHSYHQASQDVSSANTIDWHIDQGLFLIFTPGQIGSKVTEGFYIQLPDGQSKQVHFDQDDDLVLLLGDGVNQVINPVLGTRLRATPHAFQMKQHPHNRVWYGRMVLPPRDAQHPLQPQESFGSIREKLIGQKDTIGMGCSGADMVARQLEATSCEMGSMYCWHRCLVLADFNVTEEHCEGRNLELACISSETGELWPNVHDPQYQPGCYDPSKVTNMTKSDGHKGHGPNGTHTHTNSTGNKSPTVVVQNGETTNGVKTDTTSPASAVSVITSLAISMMIAVTF